MRHYVSKYSRKTKDVGAEQDKTEWAFLSKLPSRSLQYPVAIQTHLKTQNFYKLSLQLFQDETILRDN